MGAREREGGTESNERGEREGGGRGRDGQTCRQTGRQTDRQADRQTGFFWSVPDTSSVSSDL